jgi:hypothetical protein
MRSDILDVQPPRRSAHAPLSRVSFFGGAARIVDYLFGILYALFLVRFVLELLNARMGAGFAQLIQRLTEYAYAPFRGIFATSTIDGAHVVWPIVVALAAYVVLHAAIRKLLELFARA